MSASLVGSEMCIRDRERSTMTTSGPGDWPRGSVRARAQQSPVTDSPVSYTHLTLPTICSV
eukprot:6064918-Alexandrium_andersonii.AAC.1